MLKKDLIKRIEELEKENQELKVKHRNEVSATFAVTTAMQMIMANQVGNFVKPKKEEIVVTRFPDDLHKERLKEAVPQFKNAKLYKVDQELEVGEVGIIEGVLVKCVKESGNDDCTNCCFQGKEYRDEINICTVGSYKYPCVNEDRKDNTGVVYVEVKDEEN